MSSENSPVVRPSRLRRVGKYFLIVVAFLAVAAVSAHFIWKYSGSSQWEPLRESGGIKLYTLKAPGTTLNQIKGVTRVRSTLTDAMSLAQDPDVCEWAHCYEAKMFHRVNERLQYYTFRWDYPFNFRPREFVVKQQFSRIPETKALFQEVIAAPDTLPPNDCCFRVRTMHNTWRFTPIGNGELEIEYIINADDGFPYPLANLGGPQFMHSILSKMQMILDKAHEKFPNAKYDLVAGV
ncbi:MAG TPA: hypothetical protein VFV49_11115 [Thermoanaerobaculia bacterium]|nr:hypothetical protein [Thermoanaerobaculia bacterium]